VELGTIYHVFNRGNNRETIFKEPRNYNYFLEKFNKYLIDKVDVHAYCLMPNHFHFLLKIKEEFSQTSEVFKTSDVSSPKSRKLTPLEKAFKDFFITYAKAINKSYNRTGSLFQSKFKRKKIDTETYYSTAVAYIHQNPIEANLCKNFRGWKYSSYNALLSSKPTLISRHEVLDWYGGREGFVEDHQAYHDFKAYEKYLGF